MSRSRKYVFTLNNYYEDEVKSIVALCEDRDQVKWAVLGSETGESGTPHIQGCIVFKNAKSFNAAKKSISIRCHLEEMRGSFQEAGDYCKKDGDFVEFGEIPLDPKSKGKNEQQRWEGIWEAAVGGDLEAIPPRERIQYYSTFKKIKSDYCPPCEDVSELLHEWLYGPPGTGKSYTARTENSSFFLKGCNKWWDGYNGEDVVIIEELEQKQGEFMGHFLKLWADRYSFRAEIKHGSTSLIRPKKIVITSNYSIEEVFGFDTMLKKAIERRFIQRHFLIKYIS